MENTIIYQEDYTTKQLILPMDIGIVLQEDSEVYSYLELMKGIRLEKYFDFSNQGIGRNRKNRLQIINAILFGQMVNVRSTRQIANACRNDIRFLYLTGGMNPPSHTLINEVINEMNLSLESLMVEINQEIMKREKIEIEKLYVDGTKIEADANKYTFVWTKQVIKARDKLYHKINKAEPKWNEIFKEYGYKEIKEKPTYNSRYLEKTRNRMIGIVDKQGVSFVYGKGKRKMAIQRVYEQITEYRDKLADYEEKLKIAGDRNSYSKTDHDATFMHMKEDHMKNAQLKPGYNVQIGVSNEYIMMVDAYQNRSDQKTFEPFLEKYNLAYDRYPMYPVADAGYGSYENYRYCQSKGMALYQKYNSWAKEKEKKYKTNSFRFDNFKINNEGTRICPNGRKYPEVGRYISNHSKYNKTMIVYECESCEGCSLKKQCTNAQENRQSKIIEGWDTLREEVRNNLDSPLGIELRIQRSIQVEGAFGVIKEDMKFRRFTRTGLTGIKTELYLIVIGYNLKKYHNKKYRLIS
jgi:transposase